MVTYTIPTEMSSVLTTPEEGDIELEIDKNDDKFDTLNDAIETCTGFYSDAQSVAGKVGISFPGPQIQQTSAVELFVEPFSGDWNGIIACGDAVKKAGLGLQTVAENLLLGMGQLFASSGGEWEGETALSFNAHMGIHVATYQGAGMVVSQGKLIFDGISEVAQFIAGLVVELIDTALDLAVWLLEKIAVYGRPWIGWAKFVADVIQDGWAAIQGIIDAMTSLYDTITAVFDLHDAVKEWVETIPAELAVFEQLVGVFEQIPDLASTPLLTAAAIRNDLNDVGQSSQDVIDARRQAEQDAEDAQNRLDELADGIEKPGVSDDMEGIEVPEGAEG
ncbi:hypothetical protein [Nocardioides alkalitolerans]|uniref:hypothetical protein n=1 Tax=Nocardioides alkalitolerans TaxID=281714 RepID=UPI0003FF78A6|nr:hypothetical protein [Nocardioides alkalitolerans]